MTLRPANSLTGLSFCLKMDCKFRNWLNFDNILVSKNLLYFLTQIRQIFHYFLTKQRIYGLKI
ncbi:hypothetical protein [Moraxella lacunata]|uniref:hypothetical protein n=1 Tax=Moraxella lacunata TaxID=477 RepID=UPI003EE16025